MQKHSRSGKSQRSPNGKVSPDLLMLARNGVQPWDGLQFLASSNKYFGFSRNWWARPANTLQTLLHPEDQDRVTRALQQAVKRGRAAVSYRVRHADGRYRRWYEEVRPLPARNGEGVKLVTCMVRMVGRIPTPQLRDRARQRLEGYLHAVGHNGSTPSPVPHLHLLVEQSPTAMMLVTLAGEILYVNPTFRRNHRKKLAEARTVEEFIAAANADRAVRARALAYWRDEVVARAPAAREPSAFQSSVEGVGGMREIVFHWLVSDGLVVVTLEDITEFRRIETALRTNEERLRYALCGAQDGLWDWDLLTDEVYYSPRWKEMLGYAESEVEPHLSGWSRLVHPEDRVRVLQVVSRYLAGLASKFEVEFKMRHRAGHWVDILTRGTVVRDEAGHARRMVGTHVDITARKEVERTLRERESLLMAFFDSPGFMRGIVEVEENDIRHLSDNRVTAEFFGCEPGATQGRLASELGAPPEVIQVWLSHYEESRRTGRPVEFEYLHELGGETRYLSATVSYLGPGNSGPRHAYAVMDVTARKNAERDLREAHDLLEQRVRERTLELDRLQRELQSLLQAAPTGIMVIDRNRRMLRCNRAAEELLGFSAEQGMGNAFQPPQWQFLREDGTPMSPADYVTPKVIETGIPVAGKIVGVMREGADRPVWMLVNVEPLLDDEGKVFQVVVAFMDITRRLEAERAQGESETRLRLALQASRAGAWSWEVAANQSWWDEQYSEIYGFGPEESPGYEPWLAKVHPEDRERLVAEIGVLLQRGGPNLWNQEFRAVHPGRGERWHQGIGLMERDAAGDAVRFVGIDMDVTDRKLAELALRESEMRHRRLIEGMMDAYATVDFQGNILQANSTFEAMIGYSEAELCRMNFRDITPPKWHAMEEEILREQVHVRGYSDVFEKEYRHKDGWVFPVELRVFLLRNSAGQPVGMWGIIRDISQRKRLEAELRQMNESLDQRVKQRTEALRLSEQRFRTLAEATFEGVVVSRKGQILDCNEQMARILACSREQLLGRMIQDFVGADMRERVFQAVLAGKDAHFEHELIRADGAWCVVETHGHTLAGPEGIRITSVRDITQRKLAEIALRESEARLRQLSEATFEGIALSVGGRITDANAQFVAMFGYEPGEVGGREVVDFVAVESRPVVLASIRAGLEEPYEFVGLRKDGSTFPAEAHARMRNEGGQRLRVTAVRDLTALREANAQLERQRSELAQAQRLAELSEVSAGVIHQIGQPFTAIINNVSAARTMVSRCTNQHCQASATLLDTDASLKLVQTTMNRLRTLAHPERIRRERKDLNVLVTEVVSLLRREVESLDIGLATNLAQGLPPVAVDDVQFSQALLILLRNACEAVAVCKPGRRSVTVTTRQSEGGQLLIQVSDAGEGISPAALPHLFEPFFTTKETGMGVGLRLCRTIVAAHGGTLIGRNNESGPGATFEIHLPALSGGNL